MERNVIIYLIWKQREDPSCYSRVKEFSNYNKLNEFLTGLDNVVSVRVVAGLLIEEREE